MAPIQDTNFVIDFARTTTFNFGVVETWKDFIIFASGHFMSDSSLPLFQAFMVNADNDKRVVLGPRDAMPRSMSPQTQDVEAVPNKHIFEQNLSKLNKQTNNIQTQVSSV